MVNIMMGPEGSGKTKQLIGALNQAVQRAVSYTHLTLPTILRV